MKTIFLSIICTLFVSCMVTKTQCGSYKEDPGNEYTYAKAKQIYLFWGLLPLGRASANTPGDGNCEIITRYNVGDVIITMITGGIVSTYTIKVKAKKTS